MTSTATEPAKKLAIPHGSIYVTTHGAVRAEMAQSLIVTQHRMLTMGVNNVAIQFVHGGLVDKARNDCVRQLLSGKMEWMWMIDGDMQFGPEIIEPMFVAAFGDDTWDIVGGYCQLRGPPYLPTIDTGSGYWESHLPNSGIKEVIRTGGACMLVKRRVFEKMAPPWFGVRSAGRPLDVLADFDNYCRLKFDGRNPFRDSEEWSLIEKCAIDEKRPVAAEDERSSVGEDSGFCDRAKALGFRIAVQTHAVMGHVDKKVITAEDHVKAMEEQRMHQDALSGVMG